MAQDAPADTAGPSSPPPRLPEGWLPQWEGVQRQWYYVQRATGKSQWDIPTEPVVLSPSTTPTSIGAGPSQAPPSQPSTSNPQVTTTGSSLVERMESAADNVGTSSSLSSQLNGQPSTSKQSSEGMLEWHLAHNAQNVPQPQAQPFTSGGGLYMAGHFQQSVPGDPNYRAAYTDQGQLLMQNNHQQTWANAQMTQLHPTGPIADPTTERYRSFPINSQQPSHISAYAPSIGYTGNQHPGFIHSGMPPPQPQWQLEGHQTKSSNVPQPSSDQYSLSSLPQPFHGSNTIPSTSGLLYGGSASRSSHPSIASHPGNVYSGNQSNPGNTLAGHPLSRSQSHQNAGFQYEQQAGLAAASYAQPSSHDYGPRPPNAQGSFQNPGILRMQHGTGFNSGFFPAGPTAHGAHIYHNPTMQAGVHQYLPPQPQGSSQNDGTHHHAANYHAQSGQSTAHQGQWTTPTSASLIAASDPQFVSGPWASSTPPASGPPQPHHG